MPVCARKSTAKSRRQERANHIHPQESGRREWAVSPHAPIRYRPRGTRIAAHRTSKAHPSAFVGGVSSPQGKTGPIENQRRRVMPDATDCVPQLLTLVTLAKALCVSPHTVRSWIRKGKL